MDYEKYKNKGLSGLSNLGNTCFVNSCMQIISHTYELNNFLNQENYKKKLKNIVDTVLILEWDNLRQIMWSDNCIISPGKFIKTIQKIAALKKKDIFTGYSQNDLPEFLLFIVDCFHNSLSREIKMTITGTPENSTDQVAIKCFEMIKNMYSKEYSEIWNLFYGIHVSEITDLETGKQLNVTPEPYLMIDLPIPSNNKMPSLIDCFDLYVEGEILEGDNAWFNEETNQKINIRKRIQFWSFPDVLIIDFKRFNNRFQKNQILVTFPLDILDLSKYVIGYKKDCYKYELYGVCNHSGSVMGGHYTSFVKNANGNWYHFNDQEVSSVITPENVITTKAYCLFYRKKI
uniref:USP domain-containing protein n=1 Tax=viral metagenome TaxID=1070528 RepID=A0A6C0ARY5_9ZZZZ